MTAFTRRAAGPAAPATLDLAGRTTEVVAATEAPVRRAPPDPAGGSTPWTEVLRMAGADVSGFVGAPVLLDHRNETAALVGSVAAARIEGDRLLAKLRFAETPRGDEALQLIADGHLRGVSVGYSVEEWARGEDGAWIATAWTPREVSLTPIGADDAARVRSRDDSISPKDEFMNPNTAAERARIAALEGPLSAAAERGLDQATIAGIRARAVSDGWDADRLRAHLFDVIPKRVPSEPPIRAVPVGHSWDDPAVRIDAMAGALAHRVRAGALAGPARDYRGASLPELCRALLEARGERLSRHEAGHRLVTRAMTTGDLPGLLQSAAGRILAGEIGAAASPVRAICKPVEVADFRAGRFLRAGGLNGLREVPEGADLEAGYPAERGEPYRVRTFGRTLPVTRQALVNDDLGALEQVRLAAAAAAEAEAQELLRMFATNGSGWGPTLGDNLPLFHGDAGNVASSTVSTSGIATARLVLRGQRDPAGNVIGAALAFLLVGPAGETAAEQALSTLALATAEAERPIFAGRLQLLVEPRLLGAPWFLFADPAAAPMLAFVTLAQTGGIPQVTVHEAPERDAIVLKILHDFAVCPTGHVGAVRVTGA